MTEALLDISVGVWSNSCVSVHGMLTTIVTTLGDGHCKGGARDHGACPALPKALQPRMAWESPKPLCVAWLLFAVLQDMHLTVGESAWRQGTCCFHVVRLSSSLHALGFCGWGLERCLWQLVVQMPLKVNENWVKSWEWVSSQMLPYAHKLFFRLAQWSAQNGSWSKASDCE